MYLWVMNCVKARGLDIVSVVKNTPSGKGEGVKALPFPEGGMVNAKFDAHITVSSFRRRTKCRRYVSQRNREEYGVIKLNQLMQICGYCALILFVF